MGTSSGVREAGITLWHNLHRGSANEIIKEAYRVSRMGSQPRVNHFPLSSAEEEYARMLQALVRDLKQITDQVEALKDTLLMQDTAPKDLLSLLASTGHHFLTVQELATILNVDSRTIYGLRHQGLPSHRVGKELRFDPLEIATWLKKRQHT